MRAEVSSGSVIGVWRSRDTMFNKYWLKHKLGKIEIDCAASAGNLILANSIFSQLIQLYLRAG